MNVTNHLELKMFGILEDPQTSVCIKLKGDVSFFLFLLERVQDGVLQAHKPHNENHGIYFCRTMWETYFPKGRKVGVPTICVIPIFVQLLRDCWWQGLKCCNFSSKCRDFSSKYRQNFAYQTRPTWHSIPIIGQLIFLEFRQNISVYRHFCWFFGKFPDISGSQTTTSSQCVNFCLQCPPFQFFACSSQPPATKLKFF